MRRVTSVAYILLCASLAPGFGHSTSAAVDLCDDIANYIRLEDPNIQDSPGTLVEVLARQSNSFIRLNENSTESASVTLSRLGATPEVRAAIKAAFGDQFEAEFPNAWITWLQDDFGAVQAQFGHTGCTVLVFFDASGGHMHVVPPPSGMSLGTSDLCGIPTWIARIKNAPVAIEEEDSVDMGKARVTVVPWQGQNKWGKICSIEATFSPAIAKRFHASTGFCRPQVDCRHFYNVMHDFAQAHLSEVMAEMAKSSKALIARANKTPHIFEMPTFGKRALELKFRRRTLYDLSLDGTPYVAIIGSDPSWNYGILVALWQASGNELEPVAGFEFNWVRGKTEGIQVVAAGDKPIAHNTSDDRGRAQRE
jgi:hypothetical protein